MSAFHELLDEMAMGGKSKNEIAAATGKSVKQVDGALRRRVIFRHLPDPLWLKYFPNANLERARQLEKDRQLKRHKGAREEGEDQDTKLF